MTEETEKTDEPSSESTEEAPDKPSGKGAEATASPTDEPTPTPEPTSAAASATSGTAEKGRSHAPLITVGVAVIVIAALLITWAAGGFKSSTTKPPTPTTTGGVFVTTIGQSKITSLALSNGQLEAPLTSALQPTALASATHSPYLFALDNSSKFLLAINVKTRKIVEQAKVAGLPSKLVVAPDGKHALVLSPNTGNLYAVAIPSTAPPAGVALAPPAPSNIGLQAGGTGTTAYVLQSTSTSVTVGAVTPVQVATGQVGKSVPTSSRLRSIAISPDGTNVYSVSLKTESVLPFAVGKTGLTPGSPVALEMAPTTLAAVSNKALYVAGINIAGKSPGILDEVVGGSVVKKATVALPGEPLDMTAGPGGTVIVSGVVSPPRAKKNGGRDHTSKKADSKLPEGFVADVKVGSKKPLWLTKLPSEVTSIAVPTS